MCIKATDIFFLSDLQMYIYHLNKIYTNLQYCMDLNFEYELLIKFLMMTVLAIVKIIKIDMYAKLQHRKTILQVPYF